MQINVSVTPSIEKLAAKFQGFEGILLKRLSEAIWGFGLLVERGSKMASPVDTGRMRDSIGTSMGLRDKSLSTIVQTNVSYAIYVHEGTYKMKGRPFMMQGLEHYLKDGEQLVLNKVNEAINDLANEVKS